MEQRSVYRSYIEGKLNLVGYTSTCLPASMADTLSLQFGLRQIYMPRNKLEQLLNPKLGGHHLNAHNLMHVHSIDVSYNLFSSLPYDSGAMVNLLHLNLARNRLASLPPSFLLLGKLKTLDLSHNTFSRLPEHFGWLSSLEALNLANNMLVEIPPSFPLLVNLKTLDITANGMAYLAIVPMLDPTQTRPDKAEKAAQIEDLEAWEEVIDKTSKKKYYVNRITGEARRYLPKALEKRMAQAVSGQLVEGTAAYNNRRKELADQGVAEWGAIFEPREGTIYYSNNVTGATQWDIPAAMDTLGRCTALTSLKMNDNLLRALPESMSMLTNLTMLECKNNYVGSLPSNIGLASNLETIKMSNNEIRELPQSMSTLGKLSELNLTQNYLTHLPAWTGDLTSLRKLLIGNNKLQALPYKLGYCTQLAELQVFNNPMEDPPYEVLQKTASMASRKFISQHPSEPAHEQADLPSGLLALAPAVLAMDQGSSNAGKGGPAAEPSGTTASLTNEPSGSEGNVSTIEQSDGMRELLWYLRRKYLIATQGPEPEVKSHVYGINDEKVDIEPEFKLRIKKIVDDAKTSDRLDLIQNGLAELPAGVAELTGLKVLNLTAQKLRSQLPEPDPEKPDEVLVPVSPVIFTETLTTLTTLLIKRSHLEDLDESVRCLEALTEMNLSENCLVTLPTGIRKLRKLVVLNASSNRITDIPDGIGSMAALREVRLDFNRLEDLPAGICRLKNLETLSIGSNLLSELPAGLAKLENLQVLSVEKNEIHRLPPGIGFLALRHLKASHNRLEKLERNLLLPNLHDSIETLQVSNNNLLELPAIFDGCPRLRLLTIDYNPMRSPPSELLEHGMHVVIQYCRIRSERVKEVLDLLDEYGFDTDETHLTPTTMQALTGQTGFLTPDDLTQFDAALDAYLNGKYYECPATGPELVDKLDALRMERQATFYNLLLQALVEIMAEETSRGERRFSTNILRMDERRTWGRKGEDVACYAVTLEALLRDTTPNRYCPFYRPSLYKLVLDRLPPSVIEYTPEMLKDAVNDFEGPYGMCSMIDKVEFADDEYVDPDTGRERRKYPCVLPALIICRVIYTTTEARRRSEEEEEMEEAFRRTEFSVDNFLTGKTAQKEMRVEMNKRRRRIATELQQMEEKKYKSGEALRAVEEKLEDVRERKAAYDSGKAFREHQFNDINHAAEVITKVEKEHEDASRIHREHCAAVIILQKKLRMRRKQQVAWLTNDLKRKYCCTEYERILLRGRIRARNKDWRRPWDGEDGMAFEDWLASVELREEQGLAPYEDPLAALRQGQQGQGQESGDEDDEANDEDDADALVMGDFKYDSYGEMDETKYYSPIYHAYLDANRPEALLPPWEKHFKVDDGRDDQGEEGEGLEEDNGGSAEEKGGG